MVSERKFVFSIIGIIFLASVIMVAWRGVDNSNMEGQAAFGSPGACHISCPDGSSCKCNSGGTEALCDCYGKVHGQRKEAYCDCPKDELV